MNRDETIVARARGCIGARFRPHGREAVYGLDCVGVAAIAFGRAAIGDYALRSADAHGAEAAIAAAGFVRIAADAARAGDLLLLRSAPMQLHLAVLTARGFVHADVGLRRVVETPGRPAMPIVGAWREAEAA